MAHAVPEFESKHVLGKTQHFNGSVGVASALVPAAPGKKISRVFVKNANTNSFSKELKVAMDGGTDYLNLQKGEWVDWVPKNNNSNMPILQVRILGSVDTVAYEILMDFEP